ncbi:hypothetical protein HCH52_03330 [Oscillospiraceae bacterium HV4-5-C5C]|nr:hypothetical protein [Oscillospiraceae bacterium HV4-5-C5C]
MERCTLSGRLATCFIVLCGINLLSVSFTHAEGYDKDDLVQTFILETIPKGAEQVDNRLIFNANSGQSSIDDKVQAAVYTYVIDDDVYSVIDLYTTDKVRTSSQDTLTITYNDYSLPMEAIAGQLFIKNSPNNKWEYNKALNAIPGLNGFDLYGSQIYSKKGYIRILSSFKSQKNQNAKHSMPEYVITYRISDTIDLPFVPIIIILILLIIFFIIILTRKKASAN